MKTPLIYSICIKTQDEYYKRHLTHFFSEKEMNVTDNADIANIIIFHSAKFSDPTTEIIRKFRINNDTPIISLSNGYTEKAILDLYGAGIDFCGTLPMNEEELYLRIMVFIHRYSFSVKHKAISYKAGNVVLSYLKIIKADGTEIKLPERPYQLLCFLFQRKDTIVYYKQLTEYLYAINDRYSKDFFFAKRVIDVYFNRMRQYLNGTSLEIKTIRNKGWILQEKIFEHATPV